MFAFLATPNSFPAAVPLEKIFSFFNEFLRYFINRGRACFPIGKWPALALKGSVAVLIAYHWALKWPTDKLLVVIIILLPHQLERACSSNGICLDASTELSSQISRLDVNAMDSSADPTTVPVPTSHDGDVEIADLSVNPPQPQSA